MDTKVLGNLLLISGLLLVVLSLFSVYQIFTGRSKPVALFNQSSITFDPGALLAGQLPEGMAARPTSPIELLSARTLNDMFNLGAHLILMSFVSGVGVKLSSVGAQLIRPIEVRLNTVDQKSKNTSS